MGSLAIQDGINDTHHLGACIYKSTEHYERRPIVYEQGIIFVGQGAKKVYLDGKEYSYNKDNYLVLTVPLPVECEAFATEEEPFLALAVKLDMGLVSGVISDIDAVHEYRESTSTANTQSLFVAQCIPDIKDTLTRLLRVLQSLTESKVLADGLVKELI